ncbi:MAG: serpin family protein [Lachnospiraceae bacterium]
MLCVAGLIGCGSNSRDDGNPGDDANTDRNIESDVEGALSSGMDIDSQGNYAVEATFARERGLEELSEKAEQYDFTMMARMVDALEKEGDNTILSASSLNMAMGLLLEGADGTTEEAIEDFLMAQYIGDFDYATRSNELLNLYMNTNAIEVHLANSIWTDDEIILQEAYVARLREMYNAQARTLDFTDADSADIINEWCEEETEGLIDHIISGEELAANQNVLINTLYFKGEWLEPFNESTTDEQEFACADGTAAMVPMMYAMENVYLENAYATGFMKYYMGHDVAFIGILPKAEDDFSVEELDITGLLASRTEEYLVRVRMPRFTVECSSSWKEVLSGNGLGCIFDGEADFRNMSETPLVVSDVIQRTYVEVNESGTEAAAVTEISMKGASAMEEPEIKEVILNRPFVFLIYDTANDELLFIGKVNDLT